MWQGGRALPDSRPTSSDLLVGGLAWLLTAAAAESADRYDLIILSVYRLEMDYRNTYYFVGVAKQFIPIPGTW